MSTQKTTIIAILAFALTMAIVPTMPNSVFADNDGAQSISQDQSNEQSSFVFASDGDVSDSGNNVNEQFQSNEGNNALGQQENNNNNDDDDEVIDQDELEDIIQDALDDAEEEDEDNNNN